MSKNLLLVIFILALFALGIGIGFIANRFLSNETNLVMTPASTSPTTPTTTENNLFGSQTANLFGTVTEIKGNLLTIKNLDNNTTGTLKASERLTISKPAATEPSTSLSDIDLNKGSLISAELVNGQYEIITIQYFISPSLPPASQTPNSSPTPSASN